MNPLSQRRRRLAERLPQTPVLLLNGTERPRNYPGNPYPFRGDSHFLYFCGVQPAGAAAVLLDGQCHLFLEPVTVDDAIWSGPGPDWKELAAGLDATIHPRAELPAFVAKLHGLQAMPTQDPRSHQELQALLGEVPGLDTPLARTMVELRLRHDEAARAEIRKACRVTVEAHLAGLRATRPGADERDVLAEMLAVCARHGAGQSFGPIISVQGERLHQPVVKGTLKEGDLLLVDFGAEVESGFAGDVTNTWPVSGRFTDRQRQVYRVVLEAHRRSAELVKPGVRYLDVHMASCHAIAEGLVDLGLLKGDPETLVERDAHALFFPHGVGHLLGLDVHDMEDLGDQAGYAPGRQRSTRFGLRWLRMDRDLEDGIAVTVEPGFYWIPEVLDDADRRRRFADCVDWDRVDAFKEVRGIRIERDYLVTADGQELLTPGMPDEPEEVEAAMGAAVTART